MNSTIDKCECGNAATDTLENGLQACEWCAAHDRHVAPLSIATGYSQFGGEYIATCALCDYVCAYWDCGCELAHDCNGLVGVVDGTYTDPAGYYPYENDGEPADVALCGACFNRNPANGEPIGYWHETDFPVHCYSCEILIVTTLTRDGKEYVQEQIAEWQWRDGGRYGDGLSIVAQWQKTFGEEIA
jgi:hypothetical protein